MNTGVGDTVTDTARSEVLAGSTRIDVTLVLFEGIGSGICEVAVAELTIVVPAAGALVPVLTFNVITSEVVVLPLARAELYVQAIGPAPPAPGSVPHVHPAEVMLEYVVLGGVC